MTVEIRPEAPADHAVVADINRRAFGQPGEAALVEALRGQANPSISLVAELDGEVVGHILFTPVHVGSYRAMGLAPMAVAPEHQSCGIGGRLVRTGLEACRVLGERAVFVLGHPNYYPRFGFEPAADRGIRCEFPVPDELFFALELEPGALQGVTGTVHYHPEFSKMEDESS